MDEVNKLLLKIVYKRQRKKIMYRINISIITHPDTRFWKFGEQTYFFPGRHIWIPIPHEQSLELLKLLGREMRPLPPLAFVLLSILIVRAIYPNHTVRGDNPSTGSQFVFHLCRCRNIWNVLRYHIP